MSILTPLKRHKRIGDFFKGNRKAEAVRGELYDRLLTLGIDLEDDDICKELIDSLSFSQLSKNRRIIMMQEHRLSARLYLKQRHDAEVKPVLEHLAGSIIVKMVYDRCLFEMSKKVHLNTFEIDVLVLAWCSGQLKEKVFTASNLNDLFTRGRRFGDLYAELNNLIAKGLIQRINWEQVPKFAPGKYVDVKGVKGEGMKRGNKGHYHILTGEGNRICKKIIGYMMDEVEKETGCLYDTKLISKLVVRDE